MTQRGSIVISCPDCGAPHLPDVAYPAGGVWRMACRYCGDVQWRAQIELTEAAKLAPAALNAFAAMVRGRSE